MIVFEYDLVALGGGTAGLVSTAGASYLGVRAGLIEKEALGEIASGRGVCPPRLSSPRPVWPTQCEMQRPGA